MSINNIKIRIKSFIISYSLLTFNNVVLANDPTFELRLPYSSFESFFNFTTFPIAATILALVLYSAFISIFYIRARRLWSEHFEDLNRTIRATQEQAERYSLFLAADRQFLIAWDGADNNPEFEGNPSMLIEGTSPQRVLAFEEWLPMEETRLLSNKLKALRMEGIAFSQQSTTLNGEVVEIDARPVSGRAVMSIRLATGEKRMLAQLMREKKTLEVTQKQLQKVVEAIPQPIWIRDRVGRLGWVNQAYAHAVDASNPDIVLAHQVEILNSEDRAAISSTQSEHGCYHRAVTAIFAGQRRKVDVTEVVGPEGGGGFALDMSELEATQKALQRQMDAHVRTLDELPTSVAIFDHQQRLTYYNRSFADLFALDHSFLTSQPTNGELLDQLRTSGRLPEATEFKDWKNSLLSLYSATETTELGWKLPNGRSLRVVISPNPQGGLTYLFEDETERFTLETSYEELKNTQWETLMALSEGVAVFSSDGCLQFFNPSFVRIWGLEPEKLRDKLHIEELSSIINKSSDNIWRNLTNIVCSLSESREDRQFETIATGNRVLTILFTPLPNRASLFTFTDITDSVEAEKRLREHNENLKRAAWLRTEFLKSVSFELRSPLTSVVGLAQALAGGVAGPLSPKQLSYAQDLSKSADAVLALTSDILDLAGIETGEAELLRQKVSLRKTIEEAMVGLKDRLGEIKIRIFLDLKGDHVDIFVDQKRFRNMIFNLAANAIAHTSSGGEVHFTLKRENKDLVIIVKDTNSGNESSPQKTNNNDIKAEWGQGLRFSLAGALAQLHSGTIEVSGETQGNYIITIKIPEVFDVGEKYTNTKQEMPAIVADAV